jgi:membrane associated rhomboid family serine protease
MVYVTYIIIALTVFVSWQAFENSTLFGKLLNNPYQVKHNHQYYRILSHTLVHADYLHLGFNMFALYSFGRFTEQYFTQSYGIVKGEIAYILLYVCGAVVASLPSLRKHGDNFGYNSVGASGAVSAVMMAAMIIMPVMKVYFFFAIGMPAYIAILVFFAFEHYMNRSGKTNIAHDAHIWGAIFGLIFVICLDFEVILRAIALISEYPWGI